MRPGERAAPVTDHGGNLAAARRRFPNAPEPWIDLSTGISPVPYPYSPLLATAFSRLPEPEAEARLREVAAQAYGAPSAAHVAAAPGTQLLLPFVFGLRAPARAVVLGPTYAEHRRVALSCGHDCAETDAAGELAAADFAVAVNPNNPDGRLLERSRLLAIAERLTRRGGLLIVDEAFMEVAETDESLAGDVGDLPVVVLRSFGKFHGLAGVRLGFAIAAAETAALLRAQLGPWAVSGPALAIGSEALADAQWRKAARDRCLADAARLDARLGAHGIHVAGGTGLFRLARHRDAARLFETLGRQGILTRAFGHRPDLLRFGLPGDEAAWARLEAALALWSGSGEG